MTPQTKISQTLIAYLEPLLHEFGNEITREELENLLFVGTTVWNACVVDAWHGSETYVTQARKQLGSVPPAELTEYLIERKRTAFAHDLRAIANPQVLNKDGQFVIRAEARGDPASGSPSSSRG